MFMDSCQQRLAWAASVYSSWKGGIALVQVAGNPVTETHPKLALTLASTLPMLRLVDGAPITPPRQVGSACVVTVAPYMHPWWLHGLELEMLLQAHQEHY